jgi:hypothetical protein
VARRRASLSPRSGHEPANSPRRGLLQPHQTGELSTAAGGSFLATGDSFLARAQHAGFQVRIGEGGVSAKLLLVE